MMTALLDDGEFWLPSRFLSEETKVDKAVGGDAGGGFWRSESDVKVSLPKEELMYEFGFSSPVASTEDGEDEEFFAQLTRRLTMSENRNVLPEDLYKTPEAPKQRGGGSPQSILAGIGSWSGCLSNSSNRSPPQGLSPPATPHEAGDDSLGLIYAAAGQVARFKMNGEDQQKTVFNEQWKAVSKPKQNLNQIHLLQNQNASCYAEQQIKQKYLAAVRQAKNAALMYELHLQNLRKFGSYSNTGNGATSEQLSQVAWPTLHQAKAPVKPKFQAVPLQRKESAGTGVFIPRRYDTAPAAPPRKKVVSVTTNALVPAKVVQALNKSLEEINARSHPHCSPYAASMSQQSYEALMARRHALLAQQQQRTVARENDGVAQRSLEACLPQEWSY